MIGKSIRQNIAGLLDDQKSFTIGIIITRRTLSMSYFTCKCETAEDVPKGSVGTGRKGNIKRADLSAVVKAARSQEGSPGVARTGAVRLQVTGRCAIAEPWKTYKAGAWFPVL